MEIKWSESPQSVIHTAEALIEKYHPWLSEARIAFVMRSEAMKRGARFITGSTSKIPAKEQPLFEYDFLIWLSEQDYNKMSNGEREAMIDHELTHCGRNMETMGWKLFEHDVQDFAVVISRHGLWSPELRRMDKAIEMYQQETLPGLVIKSFDEAIGASGNGRVTSISGDQLKRMAEGELFDGKGRKA